MVLEPSGGVISDSILHQSPAASHETQAQQSTSSCEKDLMDTGDKSVLPWNVSSTEYDASHSPEKTSFVNLASAIFTFVSLLVGMVSNGLFLWVLGVKMKKTVNTLWFSHLIFAYLLYCSSLPFFSVYILLDFHWVFGTVVCKLVNSFFSLAMFTTVFLLTIISLDRYLLICHPVWSQHNRTVSKARKVVAVVWLVSIIFSAPYLVFRKTQELEDKTKCLNNYILSNDLDALEMEALRDRVHLALFVVRFLLAFLLPLLIIASCHCRMAWEMKKRRLVRNRKPFQVLVASVASFFICWLPYHLYHSSPTYWKSFDVTQQVLRVTMLLGECFNFCFTPILYLFVGEKFQQVFKTSLLALLKRGFMDIPIILTDNTSGQTEGHQTGSICSLELKLARGNNQPAP
ncbi:probable G-protein coupled receptor 33 [Sphaerodactylus townsendi]|uniref:probable G-protein coupled receptor 33 n=1 Tax=Sphaerodactylus townsendi TaxID=933632 RepID=UPI002026C9BA|nr:probable G-protein coupled receptor 33 [Sphaerodactylus townsendi]